MAVVDEIATPDMLLKYSLHEPRCGCSDIKAFMTDFALGFPISISVTTAVCGVSSYAVLVVRRRKWPK